MKPGNFLVGCGAVAILGLLAGGCAGSGDDGAGSGAFEDNVNSGTKYIVGMGDSYMSGEGGRWATNGSTRFSQGWEVGDVETIYGEGGDTANDPNRYCHKSTSALMHIGDGWESENLACSGATTESEVLTNPANTFKPGIDFERKSADWVGQAQQLEDFAKIHNVEAIALSIGGNDLMFADLLSECVSRYVLARKSCVKDEPESVKNLSPGGEAFQADVVTKIAGAFRNIGQAMANAGYTTDSWRVIYQLAPLPLPSAADLNKQYKKENYNRQFVGGCGLYDEDLDMATSIVADTFSEVMRAGASKAQAEDPSLNIQILDDAKSFDGHRLCDKGSERVAALDSGTAMPANGEGIDGEWIRSMSVKDAKLGSTDQANENAHPNYWGQLALRNCMRQAANSPISVRDMKCLNTGQPTTADAQSEPAMNLEVLS